MWFHPRPEMQPFVHGLDDEISRAQEAQRDTTRRFLEVVEEGQQIRQVSSEMKIRRIRNGYEDMIEDALVRRPEKR